MDNCVCGKKFSCAFTQEGKRYLSCGHVFCKTVLLNRTKAAKLTHNGSTFLEGMKLWHRSLKVSRMLKERFKKEIDATT